MLCEYLYIFSISLIQDLRIPNRNNTVIFVFNATNRDDLTSDICALVQKKSIPVGQPVALKPRNAKRSQQMRHDEDANDFSEK